MNRFAWIVACVVAALCCISPAHAEDDPAAKEDALVVQLAEVESSIEAHDKENNEVGLVSDVNALTEIWDEVKEDEDLSKEVISLYADTMRAADADSTLVAALEAMGTTEDPRAAKIIKPYLRQRDRERADRVLVAAVEAAGRVVDSSLVRPLLTLVDDSKHYGLAARAIESLGAYRSCKRQRVNILKSVVKSVARSRPGGQPRMRGGASDPIDPSGGPGGSSPSGRYGGTTSRWSALTRVMTDSLNRLTGRTMNSPEDWFYVLKSRKNRLSSLFVDEDE